MSVFGEIRRRKVFQVAAAYIVVAWLMIQVVIALSEPLGLPDVLDTIVIVLLAIGFPVALVLAWAFELTPGGIRVTPPAAGPAAGVRADGQALQAAQSRGAGESPVRGDVRFCTTPSGYRLAYSRVGSGPSLLRTGNWLSHQELEWDMPFSRPFLRDLSSACELITYDGRGTGLSDREVAEFSLDTMVEDMESVVAANGLDRFTILAFSQSCAVSIEFAVRHPDKVAGMVLYGGFAQNFRTQEEIAAMATLFAQSWGQENVGTRQMFTAALFPDATKEEFDAFNRFQKESISPENAARLFRACHAIDVREQARRVTVPTLVMHSRDEVGVPVECGREIASLIPGARFVTVESRNHFVFEREPAYGKFIDEVLAFTRQTERN